MENDNNIKEPEQTVPDPKKPVPDPEPSVIKPGQLVSDHEQTGEIEPEAVIGADKKSSWQRLKDNRRLLNLLKVLFFAVITVVALVLLFLLIIYVVPALQEIPSGGKTHLVNSMELKQSAPYKKQITQMKKDMDHLNIKYNNYTTGQSYLVINTTDNLFYLYKNKKLIRSGHCSTGSYMMLKTEEGRSWVFKTPKGKRTIQGKTTHPYWHRSDWSYIEEGTPVPPKDDPSRWEYGVLGDYSMSLGDGYMVHGTIYKRFLGMPVTHGCVRLNDEDLDVVFHALSIGSKVYIF
jgi:lipoprotein-anchoring transpeptidase ErfK/SrfK